MPVMETKTHQKRDGRASRIPNSRADDQVPLGRRRGDDPPSLGANNHSISKTDHEDGHSDQCAPPLSSRRSGSSKPGQHRPRQSKKAKKKKRKTKGVGEGGRRKNGGSEKGGEMVPRGEGARRRTKITKRKRSRQLSSRKSKRQKRSKENHGREGEGRRSSGGGEAVVESTSGDSQTGGPRFQCSYCAYGTDHKGNFTRHLRTHTGAKL